MFIGHYAPAFLAAALPRAPRLGSLFAAAQLVDFAFFGFVLGGVEHMRLTPEHTVMSDFDLYDMRFTHSLLGTLGFAAAFAVVIRLMRGTWQAAWIGAAVVASHWVLDWIVHAPDLTIAGIGPRYGLGLWNYPMIEMPLELGLITAAFVFYLSRTRSHGWRGIAAPALLATALLTVQLVNWLGAKATVAIDPVPASVPITALAAFAALTLLASWTGTTRAARAGPAITTL